MIITDELIPKSKAPEEKHAKNIHFYEITTLT